MRIRHLIRVTGVVQGVGFRPFVYRLALEHGLDGFVLNDGEGVFLEIEGEAEKHPAFLRDLEAAAPPASRIDRVEVTPAPAAGYEGFEIRRSRESAERLARVSPDLATCAACVKDILNPAGRRHRYPFTNCTNCGPRFTIIRDVPYDRPATTMAGFRMCPECLREYEDPLDRRFHAQPNACPVCGPSLTLYAAAGARIPSPDPIREVRRLLGQGFIVAVKGLGGYHLAVDATNELAVRTLRNRKTREEKPFALMAGSLAVIRRYAHVSRAEAALLLGPEAPIVLLHRRAGCVLPDSIAPGQNHLGFFLPYTPLHHLLFRGGPEDGRGARDASGDTPTATAGSTPAVAGGDARGEVPREMPRGAGDAPGNASETPPGSPGNAPARGEGGPAAAPPVRAMGPSVLVLTSGNRSDEPIAYRDADALERLAEIADYFLVHDRPIHLRCDDSVVRVAGRTPQILRRSRGYVPRVTRLHRPAPAHILAVGPLLKNTFSLAKGFDCYVGPHIGDLENLETFRAFEEGIRHFERLFDIHPSVVAHDLHPDFLSTRYALSLDMEAVVPCQHHEAHVAGVMGEHGIEGPVIGVALDGTGLGHDGTIWGGEFFVVRDRTFTRAAHLRPVPLPGGDQAAREPWSAALSFLRAAMPPGSEAVRARLFAGVDRAALTLVERMCDRRLNCPLSSGAGRAFDAAASIILGKHQVAYEGQGPMELEQCAGACQRPARMGRLPYTLSRRKEPWEIDFGPAFAELAERAAAGASRSESALLFHTTVASAVCETVSGLAGREKIEEVCLSGGVFQNQILLRLVTHRLERRGLKVYRNVALPPNDGGISFGQVILAAWRAFC